MVADRIDVLERVGGDAPRRGRGHVAEVARHITMRRLVQSNGEDHRQREHRNFLDQGEFHAGSGLEVGGVALTETQHRRNIGRQVDHRGRGEATGAAVDLGD